MAAEVQYRDGDPAEVIKYFRWVEQSELRSIASPAFLWVPCNKGIVATIDGEIVGAITFVLKLESPEIATVYVSRKAQRLGIASQLLVAALAKFKEIGCGDRAVFCDAITSQMSRCICRFVDVTPDLGRLLRARLSLDQTAEDDAFAIGDMTGEHS
jgi:GNAT superfamily N-acetyltransferase